MGGRNGGTKIYCPHCKGVQVCRAIAPSDVLDTESGQRKFFVRHPDIHFFQRGRECQRCFKMFLTGEVESSFLDELIELRDALKDIKDNAADYQSQSQEAAKTLKKLTKSISVLKALK